MVQYVRSRQEHGHRHYFAYPDDFPVPEGDANGGEHTHDDLAPLVHDHGSHTHDYADPAHVHDTSHSHTAAEVGASGTGHSHDITHSHDGTYSDPAHTHDTSGLAAVDHTHQAVAHDHDADYEALGHTHDTAHDHDAAYSATDHGHTAADVGAATTGHTHDTSHSHDLTAYATDQDLADHAATPHGGSAGEAFPVGSVFISVVSTSPATLLGYGTWSQIAQGQFLVGQKAADADFDTAEETGGAKTHTHAAHTGIISHTHPITDPGHVHDEYNNSATTGPNVGWGAQDTSTNTASLTGYDTGSKTTGISVDAPAGAVASYTHDSPSHLPPYFVAYIWKRTA